MLRFLVVILLATQSSTHMDFRFNFGGSAPEEPSKKSPETDSVLTPARLVDISIKGEEYDEMALDALFEKVSIHDDVEFSRCRPPNSTSMSGPIADWLDKSDLVPGIYEGGFKLWECCIDLVKFLNEQKERVPLKGKRVMELGCGHGFPGIFALNQVNIHSFTCRCFPMQNYVTVPAVGLRDFVIRSV